MRVLHSGRTPSRLGGLCLVRNARPPLYKPLNAFPWTHRSNKTASSFAECRSTGGVSEAFGHKVRHLELQLNSLNLQLATRPMKSYRPAEVICMSPLAAGTPSIS